MRLAHVRERHAPVGASWRLAAALPDGRWLELERARRRLAARDPRLAHNDALFREPVTTLDAQLAAGRRVEHLRDIAEPFGAGGPGGAPDGARLDPSDADDLALEEPDLVFGPPVLDPGSLRDFYAFETHVRSAWARRQQEVPEAWYRLPVFYFSNVSELRGPQEAVWAPAGSAELDYELEVGALVDTAARDLTAERAEEVIGGYFVLNDWSARDLQRDETTVRLGPAKGKDFATSIGPWLVTPDELADVRAGKGYDLAMTSTVNGQPISRGRWCDAHYSFGEMLARASADVRLRPGDLIGSGTVGGGCLLESRERLGRYLQAGDLVVLEIERLGRLESPVAARPERP
ncbi:MAG TPA: fumarylacetoacetate hydrolase family protein [Candidatus Dormibacteraeota bacterium]|nr:fumarylacetoacetate hydrolase family protein [Candidatus Dormibacteraeota bacterium]